MTKEHLYGNATLDAIYPNVLQLMGELRDYDEDTYSHSVRVANYLEKFGETINLTVYEQEELYVGGLLHDIGKIFVPIHIIAKPGNLSNEEIAEIRTHPVRGYEYLQDLGILDDFPNVLDIVKYHHERINSSGYPDRLKGNNIPVYAQMAAIADSFDAMTVQRVYQKEKSTQEALEDLYGKAGSWYNVELVNNFSGMIQDWEE